MDNRLGHRVSPRFQTYLKRLISRFEDGVSLDDFLAHFEKLSTAPLKFTQYGFTSAKSMVVTLQNIFRVEYRGETPWVFPVGKPVAPSTNKVVPIRTRGPASNPFQWAKTITRKVNGHNDEIVKIIESRSAEPEQPDPRGGGQLLQTSQEQADPNHLVDPPKNVEQNQRRVETLCKESSKEKDGDRLPVSRFPKSRSTDTELVDVFSIRMAHYGLFVPSIALSAYVGLPGDSLLQRVVSSGLKVRGTLLLYPGDPNYELAKCRLTAYGVIVPKDQESLTMVPVKSCAMLLSIGKHSEKEDLFYKTIHEICQRYKTRSWANTSNGLDRCHSQSV